MNASITAGTAGSFSKMLALTTDREFQLQPLNPNFVLNFVPRLSAPAICRGVELCAQY